MIIYFLLIGITVIFLAGYFAKDWASGFVGFIYGGIIIYVINMLIKLFRSI